VNYFIFSQQFTPSYGEDTEIISVEYFLHF